MATLDGYMTSEYRTLLRNAAIVLSIVMLAVIGADVVLAVVAPSWPIRLISLAGSLVSIGSGFLLYTSIRHFIDYRDPIVILRWVSSFICLLIGLLPIMLFVYLNLDWRILATYGRMAIDVYLSFDNFVLPLALMFLVSMIYWTMTVQLYRKSYITYLCINKKEDIYGK